MVPLTPLPKVPRFCYTIGMTSYAKIFDVAIENYGLITTAMARRMGIAPGSLVDLAYRGRLTRIGQGVNQLVQYSPGERDPYAQAVALVGEGAYLYGESVVAMLGLAPTDPDKIYVATTSRVRKSLGDGIKVCRGMQGYKPVPIEGIPSQEVADAILSARATMPGERLKVACAEALRIGKITEADKRGIENEI